MICTSHKHADSYYKCDIIWHHSIKGASGHTVGIGITAADFCYAWTDSPMLTEISKLLLTLKQQSKYMLSAWSFKMAAPIITEEVLQILNSECIGNPQQ